MIVVCILLARVVIVRTVVERMNAVPVGVAYGGQRRGGSRGRGGRRCGSRHRCRAGRGRGRGRGVGIGRWRPVAAHIVYQHTVVVEIVTRTRISEIRDPVGVACQEEYAAAYLIRTDERRATDRPDHAAG